MEDMVSIIIPTYGGNESLVNAINSALSQDYLPIEIVVVDDNNPNSDQRKKTEEIMKQFGEEPRVRYIKHEKNKNWATARNTGIKNSRGEYIAFLDDDDIFLPGKIKKQVKYLTQHKEFGGAYTWRIYRGQVVGSEQTGDLSKALLEMSFTPCTPSLILRRECVERIKGFDESYNRHQDYEFFLRFFEYYKLGVVK